MPEAEKAQRQAALYEVVTTHTSHHWAAVLVKMLLSQISTENTAHKTPYLDLEMLSNTYHKATKRLLLFDYDVRDSFAVYREAANRFTRIARVP
jgi:trehalose 6-phosphate synthase/phosphatase